MKGILTLRKLTIAVAMCMAMLCLPGYSEPTPEQVKERTELLKQAIESNDVERAKLCIRLGADVNAKVYHGYEDYRGSKYHDCYTILTYAVCMNRKNITELLIESGVNINLKDNEGDTALMYAAFNGYRDIAELLIKSGADVNAKKQVKSWVKFLGNRYASFDGNTALLFAVFGGHRDIAELLIKSGADVNAKNNDGQSALIYAAHYDDHKDIAELLIKSGADVNAKTNNGETALMMAISNIYYGLGGYSYTLKRKSDIAELLIKSGADMNAKNNDGETALMYAVKSINKDITELLVKSGADSKPILIWAVKENDSYAVEILINAGANPNATDSEGLSVLTHAILYGQNDIADLLRAAGAKE